MVWHVNHNRALHRYLFVLTVATESVPWVSDAERASLTEVAPNYWRVTVRYGFMERPDIPALLGRARFHGCKFEYQDVTYYVGHETVVSRGDGKALPAWEEALFTAMQRNAVHVTDYFRLPADHVVEIGRQVAI